MDRARVTNSFVLLLALGVVASSAAPSKPSSQASTAAEGSLPAPSQEVQATQSSGYQKVLQQHFGPNFKVGDLCSSVTEDTKHDTKYIVHALIVTLPDPSDPHLADAFDNYLGSVQLALARTSYLLDQLWLPEVMRRKEQAKSRLILSELPQSFLFTQNGIPVGAVSSMPATSPEPDLRDQPGIMLFRRDRSQEKAPKELLFLLLVPETPTGGIRQTTLWAALERAASLLCEQRTPADTRTIRIVGPSFSGAAESLARGIERWKRTSKVDFDIVTGSATNADTQMFLHKVGKFSATVTPDEVMKDFYQYVARKFTSYGPRIAILTEFNTSYGQGAATSRIDSLQEAERTHSARRRESCTTSGSCVLDLYFPLHVSQLSAEYEKTRSQRASSAMPEGDARLLSLNLLEQDEPSDVPPAMSALTKYNADLSLVNSLMAIQREHIHVVGIQATDPRDELFLAQKVKHTVPDVQLFLMDSELLFSHTAIANEMRGALVVARYPLFNLNQLWTPPRQLSPRVQFVNGSSQGVYNAAILQLEKFEDERKAKLASADPKLRDSTPVSTTNRSFVDKHREPEYEAPARSGYDNSPKPLEYGEPFELNSSRPPLWVGMVGHYGIWPIGTLGPSGSLKQYVGESTVPWDKVNQYTAEFTWKDTPIALIFPQGWLHGLATLSLFLIILWHAAQRLPGVEKLLAGEQPLVCAAPASMAEASRLGYAAVQLLGWQSLIAIYLAAVGPIVAPRIAAFKLSVRGQAQSMEITSWAVLIFWLASVLTCISLAAVLVARVPWKTASPSAKSSDASAAASNSSAKSAKPTTEDERTVYEWITLLFCCFAAAALLVLSVLYFGQLAFVSHEATQVFLSIRSRNWLSGISPTLPLLFLGAAVYATAWLHLYRLASASTDRGALLPDYTPRLHELLPGNKSLQTSEDAADDVALGRLLVPGRWLVLLAVATMLAIVLLRIRPSAEPDLWTWLVRGLLGLLILGIVHGLVLLVQLWRTINMTLDQLAGHPVVEVLKGMRDTLAAMVGLHPYAPPRREQVLACECAQFNALQRWAAGEIRLQHEKLPNESTTGSPGLYHWPRKELLPEEPLQPNSSFEQAVRWASKNLTPKAWLSEKSEWSRSATQLVALEVVRALARRTAVIRALIGILTIDALVLLVVTRIYPFQPHRLLSGLSWFLLLAVVIVSAWALVAMERNAVLSYASGSKPGKVTWDASFVLHLALFVGLPLAALVAANFPEIGSPIFESLQPLIRAAR